MKHSALFSGIVVVFLASTLIISTAFSQPKTKKMSPDRFSAVYISIPAKVYIEQGNSHNITIDADQKTLDKIVVEVQNNKLKIEPEDHNRRIKSPVTIHITMKEMEKLALAGSGDIFCEKSVKAEDLKLVLSGSGNIRFDDLQAEELQVSIAGSGDMVLKGKGAEKMKISLAGSGDLDAADFMVEGLKCSISGSGKCKVYATDEIDASLAGSGKIMYRGDADVNSRVAGSGRVAKIE